MATLPFAGGLWWGELPVCALIRLPKAGLKSGIHNGLIWAVRTVGLSSGSPSLDYIHTHRCALCLAVLTPALAVICAIAFPRRLKGKVSLAAALVCMTLMDLARTLWFDERSHLMLFSLRITLLRADCASGNLNGAIQRILAQRPEPGQPPWIGACRKDWACKMVRPLNPGRALTRRPFP
jgi:hypothetical protein